MLEGYNAPYATPAFREFLADEAGGPIHAAQGIGDTGAEPVVDAIRDGVEGRVWTIYGYPGRGTAKEGSLEGIGEGEAGERLEDWWMVGDNEGRRTRDGFLDDLWCETGRCRT